MSQRHNTICPETRVNDSPLLARPKLVSGSAQRPAIGRTHGKLVDDAGCWTNGNTGRPCPPDAFFVLELNRRLVAASSGGESIGGFPETGRKMAPPFPHLLRDTLRRSRRPRHSNSIRVGFVVMDRQRYISTSCTVVYCTALLSPARSPILPLNEDFFFFQSGKLSPFNPRL